MQLKKRRLYTSLEDNLKAMREDFDGSADFTVREMNIKGVATAVITIEGMVNKEALAISVVNPIVSEDFSFTDKQDFFNKVKNEVLSISEVTEAEYIEDVYNFIMSGFAALAIDGTDKMLAIGVQGFSFRSVSEPENEVVQRGSREGFVEPLRINMTLIRRRLKNPAMKFETMTVGKLSRTEICLCYIRDIVSPKMLDELKRILQDIELDTILASGYISPYIKSRRDFSLFSGVGTTERPDALCGKINEGRIAILIDGTPVALIVPYLFVENFQTVEDYSDRPFYATFTRWLKYLSFLIAVLTPGIYVALATFNPELFTWQLLSKIAKSVSSTPFPLMLEVLIIHFIYEIMREAGLRLPKPLGHAVSIVGALVIGETAVNAGIIGSPTLMVVALTAIASYVIPDLYAPVAILRLLLIIAGGVAGVWGISLVVCAVLVNICGKSTLGVPYTAPLSPFSSYAMRDVLIRAGWRTLGKKRNRVQDLYGSTVADRQRVKDTD